MRIPRLPARPWVAVAAVLAAAAILLTVIHQGNATANTGPPGTPDNTLAHLIVPDGEEPRIRVSWDAPDAEVSDYTITRADGQTFSANGAATTFSDHTVEPGTTYAYSIAARSADGASPASESASADVPDTPSAPGNLTGAIAEPESTDETATVNLTWTASTVPAPDQCDTAYPLTGYTVVRSDGDQETELGTADAGATSFIDNTAAFSRQYTYRVMARNAIGASSSETAVTVFSQPVLPPTGLTASITDPFDGNVSLSWNAPTAGADIVGYMVFRYLGPDPYEGSDIPTTLDEMATETALVDATAQAGVMYSYIVMARSADNVSLPSNIAVIEAPAPASGLTATPGDGTIELSWSAPTSGTAVEYRVARQQTDGDWATLADTTDSTHSDETAQPNVVYRYRVQHRNQYGGSTWAESETVTLTNRPGQPTNLSAGLEGNDVILNWMAPEDGPVEGYNLQHQSGDTDWQDLTSTTAATHRHVNVAADVEHHYRVRAHNQGGNSLWSDEASATRIMPPATPSDLSATVDGNDIAVSWTRPDAVHLNGYEISISRSDTGTETTEALGADATSYRTTADPDVTYSFKVRAHNDGGQSNWTDTVEATRIVPPAAPDTINAQAGDADITVTWSQSTSRFVDGYHLRYGVADTGVTETVNIAAGVTSFTHSDSIEGTAYQYEVRAHNSAGNGPWSAAARATRLLAPGVPTSVTAAVSGGAIVVEWNAPTGSIVATYEVEYGIQDSDETDTASVDGAEMRFTHVNPQGDTRYEYRVRARNAAGDSEWSQPADAMRVIPPSKPTSVTVAISGDDLQVSWTAPTSTFLDGYQVEHRQVDTQEWTRNEVGASETGFTHSDPARGVTFEYRVRALNDGGYSSWTEPVNGVWYSTAAPPARVYSMSFGPTQLLIRWESSPTDGVDGYEIRQRIDGGDWNSQKLTATNHIAAWNAEQSKHEYSVRATIDGEPDFYLVQQLNNDGTYTTVESVKGHKTTARYRLQPFGATASYRVVARNHVGVTGSHDAADLTTLVLPEEPRKFPEIPSRLDAEVIDGNAVKLTWKAPTEGANQVTGYRIYRKEASLTGRVDSYFNTLVALTPSAATTFVDHTAEAGVLYEYAVAAYRPAERYSLGAASNTVSAQTW